MGATSIPTTASATPAESAQAPTRTAALALLLRKGEATAAELADSLGVSVQVMRRHLRSLEDDGLVQACPAAEGPGRPSNRWHLTSKGQGQFPDGSEHFALSLLESMAGSLPPELVQNLLEHQALQKAGDYRDRVGQGSLQERLERLVDLRRHEGYVAEFSADGDGWVPLEELQKLGGLDLPIWVPYTDETRGFLSADRLAQMRDGAILINTARGALLDDRLQQCLLRMTIATRRDDLFVDIGGGGV